MIPRPRRVSSTLASSLTPLLALVLLATASACGEDARQGGGGSDDAPVEMAAPSSDVGGSDGIDDTDGEDATEVPGLTVDETLDLENDSGYSVTADVDFSVGEITEDPTSSLPGETEVVVPVQGSVTVTNTTSDRETPISVLGFTLRGVYDPQSPVCLDLVEEPSLSTVGDYCLLPLGPGIDWSLTEDDLLGVDGSSTRTTEDNFSGDPSESRFLVDESSARELTETLVDPVGVVLTSPYDEEFWGSGGDNWLASTGCIVEGENSLGDTTSILQLVESSPSDLCG